MTMERGARKPVQARTTILVASDNTSDAASVKDLLAVEFDQVFLSTDPDAAVEEFESRVPDVLVLAFNSLEDAERYYLGLYRLSTTIHLQPHRTIILCSAANVRRAYQACRKESFDDYVQFWPMTNDAPRLLMSVHHALRDLSAARDAAAAGHGIGQGVPAAAELASPAPLRADALGAEGAPRATSAHTSNAAADCPWPTVLVVDDDDFQRTTVSKLFAKEKYRLAFAASGIEALDMLRTIEPDLVLMDIRMPDLDGIETTRRLKGMPQFAGVPVIMVTGHSEGASVRDSLKAGAIDFIVKPIDRDTLLAKISLALHA